MQKINGKLLVIDGVDGSGKKTQTKLLKQKLKEKNIKIKTISFPQYNTKSAGMVENYLLLEKYGSAEKVNPYQASIFYACDRFDASFKIKDWLKQGYLVIIDRYVGSNMAFQGAKISNLKEREKYFQWNYDLEFNIFELPKPNINFILYVPAEIAYDLIRKRENFNLKDGHEKNFKYLQNAEKVYLELIKKYKEFKLINCVENKQLLKIEDINKILIKEINKIYEF